ncbi:hypothetical protein HGRIS_008147 [Hohenbuehelia grisea]|uniref:Acetyl-CoA synthetase-like protein n=1 Tax=Hohenbuehelia grisea TaxID=104357 RepID=A0ABR3J755_9AGAR
MSVFYGPPAPYIPDDLTIPQFILDSHHPVRPVRSNDIPWFVDDASGTKVGYEELRSRSFGLANALKLRYNIGENDVVCIFSANHVDYPVAVWASHRLGSVVSTANPAYTTDELLYQLETTKPVVLFTQADSLETALASARQHGLPNDRIVILDQSTHPSFATLPGLIAYGLRQQTAFVERRLAAGEAKTKIAFLCFSSGTTGRPKAVAISHYAVIANVIQISVHHRIDDPTIPVSQLRWAPGDVCTAVLPFFHIYGLIVNMHFAIFVGTTIVVIPKFNFGDLLESVMRHRITHLMIVPPMLVLFCKHPAAKKYDFSHIKGVYSGAAPLSMELTQQAAKVFPNSLVGQGYGMTETATAVTLIPMPDRLGNGSVGVLLPGCAAKVIKQDGKLGGVGDLGELVITGPSMAAGYTNNAQATSETFVDGWVHTGDEVYFDKNGEMWVVDRLKELIKVRGFQVPPAELEGHLLGHPYVSDVCVVPIPDEYSGEIPRAYVVPHADIASRIADPAEAEKVKAELTKVRHFSVASMRTMIAGLIAPVPLPVCGGP